MSMNVTLSKIILFGKEIEKLKNFYQEHFGFTLVEETRDEWALLNTGNIDLAFHKIGAQYRRHDEPFHADSNTKLVFEVSDDLPVVRENLLQKGVKLRDLKSFPGTNAWFCDGEDPEGNVFQLRQNF
jgi:predicted enzyme related to lactoylglutathione lyase